MDVVRRLLFGFLFACVALAGARGAWAYSNATACTDFAVGGISLGCAGPATVDVLPGKDFNDSNYWPGWAVLSLTAGAQVAFDGKSTGDGGTATGFNGNLGIWGANKLAIKGDAEISGNVYFSSGMYGTPVTSFDNSALDGAPAFTRVDGPNDFVANFTSDFLLGRAQHDALVAADAAFKLAPTVTTYSAGDTALSLNTTITATNANCTPQPDGSCRVVVNFGGKLDLKNFKLTLDAGTLTNVDFILNIGTGCAAGSKECGDLLGNGTSGITLNGVAWSDVLINVRDDVAISSDSTGDNRYSGVMIVGGSVGITSGDLGLNKTQWTGEIIGFGNMNFDSGAQVTNPGCSYQIANAGGCVVNSITFVPAPGTLLLMLAGALAALSRRFRVSPGRNALQPV